MPENPPAFPRNMTYNLDSKEPNWDATEGMTLRDYFAAHGMGVLMETDGSHLPHNIARKAYRMADAMLEAREKK